MRIDVNSIPITVRGPVPQVFPVHRQYPMGLPKPGDRRTIGRFGTGSPRFPESVDPPVLKPPLWRGVFSSPLTGP